jgi:uncharacterized SAM-binding protein YcdF (DUF218 family)
MRTPSPARDHARPGLPGCRLLGAVAILAFAVIAFTPAVGWLARQYVEPARLERADAIVVLGGAFGPGEWLDASSLQRLVEGMRLYRQGLAPLLVLSGGMPRVGPPEAEIRARLARALGIPDSAILPVLGAHTTYDESLRVEAALRPRGVRSILLVTGPFHLVRARIVFERAGFAVRTAPATEVPLDVESPAGRFALARVLAQEVLGWIYYHVAGYA